MSRDYRSPITGKGVSGTQYIDEWHTFIHPMAEKYGLIALSYDPDIRFARQCNRGLPQFYAETVDLPLWFVKVLISSKPV